MVPPLDERDFDRTITPIVQEYFEHADSNEVVVSVWGKKVNINEVSVCHEHESTTQTTFSLHIKEQLAELNLGPMRSDVPSLAVSLALEAKASQRELTSRLLADLCGSVLSFDDMENSFDKLLRELPDLVLDTPGAPQVSL